MVDDSEIKDDRDKNLVLAFADRARGLLRDYSGWVEDEIKYCQTKIEAVEVIVGSDNVPDDLKTASDLMNHILRHQLPNAKVNLRDKCKEIEDGSFDSIVDAQQWIQDGIARFESIAWHMLRIRKSVDDHWERTQE